MQKTWKRLVFQLHPDKMLSFSVQERAAAAEALHRVHKAKEEFRESVQASGAVEVPGQPQVDGRPVCTRSQPGQRRYECRWLIPEQTDPDRPIEKYEVYGPRVFSHTGEPMEWVLLATLPRLQGCFVFVEESPTQQEVMWAGDRMRVPAVPLTVYSCNGRGRSEALYFQLPWLMKFPWLQGTQSLLCRQCCSAMPRPVGKQDKVQCTTCSAWLAPNAAAIILRCPKCQGECLWDGNLSRLDCRVCGRQIAVSAKRPPARTSLQNGNGGACRGGGTGAGAQSVPPGRRRTALDGNDGRGGCQHAR